MRRVWVSSLTERISGEVSLLVFEEAGKEREIGRGATY